MVDFRKQFKPSSIKKLRKHVEEDDAAIGVSSGEYLSLEDGKTLKIRIFPPHPGNDDFYISKKSYWLTITGNDGEKHRATVLDSKQHGGTKWDLVDEYVKFAKEKHAKNTEKLDCLTATGPNSQSLNPAYSWVCYADKISDGEQLKAKYWEFKKMVRDGLNKLALSEDDDDPIEVDPFTDPDEGIPVLVKFLKKPNKKKGENYYEISFPKKSTPRPLTDEELEAFAALKPLKEALPKYGMRDFERALDGLQNFDEENELGLFDDDDWLDHVEEIKAQYDKEEDSSKKSKKRHSSKDDDEDEDESPKSKKKASKKEEPEDDDDDEDEPVKKSSKKTSKKVEPDEEEDEEDDDEESDDEDGDELDDLDRAGLKKYISDNDVDIHVKKSMSDDDIREAIREAVGGDEDDEEDDEEEEDEDSGDNKPKLTLAQIQAELAKKKK